MPSLTVLRGSLSFKIIYSIQIGQPVLRPYILDLEVTLEILIIMPSYEMLSGQSYKFPHNKIL